MINDKYFYKERRHRHREEGHAKTGAEVGGSQPQAKDRLGPPEAERGHEHILPKISTWRTAPLTSWFPTPGLFRTVRKEILIVSSHPIGGHLLRQARFIAQIVPALTTGSSFLWLRILFQGIPTSCPVFVTGPLSATLEVQGLILLAEPLS